MIPHAQDGRVQNGAQLNLFKWERAFEALHGVSFVMGPSGSAVDSLSGFLTRGVLACALGLVHNHLVCLSDHSLRFFISPFKYGLEVHLRILKGKHRTRPHTLGTGSGLPRGCHFIHWTINSSPRFFSKEVLRVTDAWNCNNGSRKFLHGSLLTVSITWLPPQGLGHWY